MRRTKSLSPSFITLTWCIDVSSRTVRYIAPVSFPGSTARLFNQKHSRHFYLLFESFGVNMKNLRFLVLPTTTCCTLPHLTPFINLVFGEVHFCFTRPTEMNRFSVHLPNTARPGKSHACALK